MTRRRGFVALIWITLLLGGANGTLAQGGWVGLFEDPYYGACNVHDDGPGVVEIYVVFGAGPIDGVRFKVEASPGVTMTYLSETHHVPVLEGDTQSGITFCLDEPAYPPVLLATIRYATYGTSATCSELNVVPHPGSNTIDVTFEGGVYYSSGRRTIVNYDAECGSPYCGGYLYYGPPENPYDFCEPVATEDVTWGVVKTLYR